MEDQRTAFLEWIEGFRAFAGRRTANEPTAAAHMAMQELSFFCARKEFEHIPSVLAALRPDWRFRPTTESQVHYEAALDIAEIAYNQLGSGRTVPTFEEMWEYWQTQYAAHMERERERLDFLAKHDAEVAEIQGERRELLANRDTFLPILGETQVEVPDMPGLWPMVPRE